MATTYLDRFSNAVTVLDAVTAPTPDPTSDSTRYQSRTQETVCTYIQYTGTVDATLRLWLYDGDQWYKGATHDLDGSAGDEAVDWDIGVRRHFTFQVEDISGGGSVTIRLEGV